MVETYKRKQLNSDELAALVAMILSDLKAESVKSLNVGHLTALTDVMIIASGRSSRHVSSLSGALVQRCSAAGYRPIGVEGGGTGEWVLVDLVNVVIHIMLPKAREFYNLEALWDLQES